MALRPSFAPLRPDLDDFLFSAIGAEHDGVPLSMISVLTRLDLDPWEEAGRLSSLRKRDAVEQLLQMVAKLPGTIWPVGEAPAISARLIDRLPTREKAPKPVKRVRLRLLERVPARMFWPLCCLIGAAALAAVVASGGFPVGS